MTERAGAMADSHVGDCVKQGYSSIQAEGTPALGDDVRVVTEALLLWLVVYAGLLAVAGFFILVVRGFSGRSWTNRAVLRASSAIAFVASAAFWLFVMLAA